MPGSQHLTPPAQRLSAEEISKKANLLVYEPGYVLPDHPRDISQLDKARIMARVEFIQRSNASRTRHIDASRTTRRVNHGAGKYSKSRGKGKGKRRGKSRGRSKRKSKGTRR
jgi:hypothetical protein